MAHLPLLFPIKFTKLNSFQIGVLLGGNNNSIVINKTKVDTLRMLDETAYIDKTACTIYAS